jgi:hypothetical protein
VRKLIIVNGKRKVKPSEAEETSTYSVLDQRGKAGIETEKHIIEHV